jgi:hypothetical protein
LAGQCDYYISSDTQGHPQLCCPKNQWLFFLKGILLTERCAVAAGSPLLDMPLASILVLFNLSV